MVHDYSRFQAWAYDRLIGGRTLRLHDYILRHDTLGGLLAESQSRRLLDVGCGGGQAAIHLKEVYPQLSVVGVDLSAGQIARARRRVRGRGNSIRFEVGSALLLPFPDASFDVVYSLGSAKHWPDQQRGFAECWRVLKPTGELLVADNTSDATFEDVRKFCAVLGFSRLMSLPLSHIFHKRLIRECRPVEAYRAIAARLQLPPGTVSKLESLPVFRFRTRKPELVGDAA